MRELEMSRYHEGGRFTANVDSFCTSIIVRKYFSDTGAKVLQQV